MYSKTAAKTLDTALIDSLQPQITTYFEDILNAFGTLNFMQSALKYLPPLALLNRIQKEIALIKEEDLLKIMEYNILGLPALVIDEKVVSAGKKLSLAEVKELITK